MEWYEIIGFIVVWLLGLCLRGKIYEFRRDYNKNDSWKSRSKR
jgi:hypothetical protein